MTEKPDSNYAIGLEYENSELRAVQISQNKGKLKIERIFEVPIDKEHVKPLYIDENTPNLDVLLESNLSITSLDSTQTLVRSLEIKLKKDRDIDAVLAFQAEPHLPYPIDESILDRIKVGSTHDGTLLSIIAVRKTHLQKHLDSWAELKIEPEAVTCEPAALMSFATHFHSSETPYFVVHLGHDHVTCVLIKDKKLLAAQACLIGLKSIDGGNSNPLRLEIMRTLYSLGKVAKGAEVTGILVTGCADAQLAESLLKDLNKTLWFPNPTEEIPLSSEQLQRYAIPLGAALSVLPKSSDRINFRQNEFAYPHPWKRYKKPIAIYLALCIALGASLYILGESYLGFREDEIKKEYVDLLASMNKPYKTFELEYLSKNPHEHRITLDQANDEEEVVSVTRLSSQDLYNRLHFLEKSLQSTPDTFPLLPHVPRVSDVLAWLSTHPKVVGKDPTDQKPIQLLQLEHFSYTMVKRPDQSKKQEKYQVKVELEFTTPTPKLAREFHDALIAPNDIVDPKGEVKWSSNRGKYRTSFMLKDKTAYPSSGF